MPISHREILEEMTPEQRARVEARAKELIEEELARRDAFSSLQQQARRSGAHRLSQKAIEAEIAAARKKRRTLTKE